ncbi:acyl-CoA-binding protein [Sinomicrobium weinanense]|uniref:Acyl-CoA-binding protein n=1 Tax=Sinomicrobium weinanense TaxID=2842200 RepID=A0A926JRV1_9FLAO|nr:acyl-CoA-binding protein [Sinomicrobium weinanense]MBC9796086.1 acyl-CoA-binding protein [Sinomicrobium weinanense]MBU3124755.1 acyl-CoA-binding protein [Sinomicrobium weinanense]
MTDEALNNAFDEAVELVNNYTDPLPADFLLRLYAYYKIANRNYDNPGSRKPLINAFKANALFQARNISEREAKEKYVRLVHAHLKDK